MVSMLAFAAYLFSKDLTDILIVPIFNKINEISKTYRGMRSKELEMIAIYEFLQAKFLKEEKSSSQRLGDLYNETHEMVKKI